MKIGKRELYKLSKWFFKDINFPDMKSCEYFYCSHGHNEVLSFSSYVIIRNVDSGIFTFNKYKLY